MKYLIAFLCVLGLACIAVADEFTDRLAQFEATTAKLKKSCDCNGPAKAKKSNDVCHCYRCADCQCSFQHECFTKKAEKPKKAPLLYKHVCGCPSMSCNCAPLGGCHCAENAMFNRVNPQWQASPSGGYSLWRGNEQLGYFDGKTYWPLNADGEWCEPTRAPIPLPRQQQSRLRYDYRETLAVAQAAPVCRS